MPLATIAKFVDGLLQSQLLDAGQCAELLLLQASRRDARELAQELLRRDWLTAYQVNQIMQGKGAALSFGPFILLERIGEGGMGQVFKARQVMLNRVVALKVIRKQNLANPKATLRFLREIRAAGQLSHRHIVRAYDADQINGIYYIAMEFIDGVDLARLVHDEGPLPIDQACEYIRQAALGLQHAHERGMVHRDIKPANLLVTRAIASDRRRSSGLIPRPTHIPIPPSLAVAGSGVRSNVARSSGLLSRSDEAQHYPWGVVKVLDLGLARYSDPFTGNAATHLTQVGAMMGTPEYIAPEQARDSHTSDIRADLYSLGCTLYFLLTGQPPFSKGTVTEKLLQHQCEEAEPVALVRRQTLLTWKGPNGPANICDEMLHVPAAVEEVLRRLLSKEPSGRYQTPISLANELQTILKQMATGTLPAEDDLEATTVIEFLQPGIASTVACEGATTVEPIVLLARRPPPSFVARKFALLLAALGGLACLVLITVLAVLMSGKTSIRANTKHSGEPRPKVKPDDGNPKRGALPR